MCTPAFNQVEVWGFIDILLPMVCPYIHHHLICDPLPLNLPYIDSTYIGPVCWGPPFLPCPPQPGLMSINLETVATTEIDTHSSGHSHRLGETVLSVPGQHLQGFAV